ncbi:MAG: restriction endonuclease subunit S [Deltaproteobacteria bacterium]|nr:restriction endonuclease subunit S [Deltaproteobacteria bacterium]
MDKTTATHKIPAGYKQTEIGVIPKDWDVKELREIVDFTNGKAHENFISDYGDYVVVNSKFISSEGQVVKYSNECFVPAPANSILMVMSDVPNGRAIAKCFLVDKSDKYTVNQRICALRPKIVPKFLFYKIDRNPFYLSFDDGVKQTNLRKDDVLGCMLSIPKDKQEQTAVATALSDVDSLIGKLEQLIEKKKNIKQGAMQALLTGKRRLPGYNSEWQNAKLGDFFSLSGTYSKTKFIDEGGSFFIMDMGSVSSVGKMITTKKTFLSTDLLRTGDLVMPKDDIGGGNIIGKVAYIDQDNKYVLGDHVYKLSAKTTEISTLFFAYLLNSNEVNSELKKKVTGSAQLGLGRKSVEEQNINFPKLKTEQAAITTILSDMDAEIEKLESQLTKYQNIKQGMMQTLLTGKIRIAK